MKQRIYKIHVMHNSKWCWWLRITARNGKIVAATEIYPSRRIAIKTARALAGAKLVVEEP